MSLRRTVLMSVVASALMVTTGIATADSGGQKPDAKGKFGAGDNRLIEAEHAAGRQAQANRPTNAATDAELAAVQANIAEHVRAKGTQHTFGTYLDQKTGKIVVETDAPDELTAALVAPAKGKVDKRSTKVQDNFSRRADTSPFWGGAGVTASANTPWCSTGFTVQNSAGTRYMVTAGHCFSDGTSVQAETGGAHMGWVWGNGLPSQDMEIIYGRSYGTSIYVGGVNSSTGNPVVAAMDPVVGYNAYCHSGRTTGENCGHTATSVTAQVCTSSGCKSPVIAFTGGNLPQGGDSGSPFYAKSGTNIHIRGIIIAVGGGTAYAEKWSRIASRFGVTIAV